MIDKFIQESRYNKGGGEGGSNTDHVIFEWPINTKITVTDERSLFILSKGGIQKIVILFKGQDTLNRLSC